MSIHSAGPSTHSELTWHQGVDKHNPDSIKTQSVPFIVSPSTAVLSHRTPAPAGTFRVSCLVEGNDKRDQNMP